jgi:hypothetical protein
MSNGLEVPEASPAHPLKTYPAFGVAEMETTEPESWNTDPVGEVVPPPAGTEATESSNCVTNVAT